MKRIINIFIIIIIMIIGFSFDVYAKDYSFYLDSTCGRDEEDCYTNLDELFEDVSGDKTSGSDKVNINICDASVSFSHSYTINGSLKFVIDDVGNENNFELNGKDSTITTGKQIEITGNAKMTISNINIVDTLADARNHSFTLAIYSQKVKLNSVRVNSLKYMGIFAGDELSEYDIDGVQVSGAEVGLDYYGKTISINNSTFDDNTMGFVIGGSEGVITNSKINSIYAYDKASITIDKTNNIIDNPLKVIKKEEREEFANVDLDDYFIVSFDQTSVIKLDLVKDNDFTITSKDNKVDLNKLFNIDTESLTEKIDWKSSNEEIASIKEGFVLFHKSGEVSISASIPDSQIKMMVNYKIKTEEDKTIKGTIKNIVKNPETYSTIFIVWLLLFVIIITVYAYSKRKKEEYLKDVI